MDTTAAGSTADSQTTTSVDPQVPGTHEGGPRYLCRPVEDRMLAGVASGIAWYLGVDVTIIRVVFAVLTVIGGAGIPIYLAGLLLIPEEGSDQSIAGHLIQSLQRRAS